MEYSRTITDKAGKLNFYHYFLYDYIKLHSLVATFIKKPNNTIV